MQNRTAASPLIALRDHVRERDPEALTPFPPGAMQSELSPLVDALARVKGQIAIRRRFVADAAHQLRTPLTLLKTRAGVGLRARSRRAKDEALARRRRGQHDASGQSIARSGAQRAERRARSIAT